MNYKIRIMANAKREMREITEYIAKDLGNPAAALRRLDLIDEKIQTLEENPARYPFVQDEYLASKGFRWVAAKTHLIFYTVCEESKTVSVMRVLNGRRDWSRLLRMDAENLSGE